MAGKPDPSVFSTEHNREGIQLGTAIALLSRASSEGARSIEFRHFWGAAKRQELVASLDVDRPWTEVVPQIDLGLPFFPAQIVESYFSWPLLPELLAFSSPGVNTSRDQDLVDIDLDRLRKRIDTLFDKSVSDQEASATIPSLLSTTKRFDAVPTRRYLQTRGIESGQFLRYAYRPFDARWVYWHPVSKLLDEKRPELQVDLRPGNLYLTSRQKAERSREGTPFLVTSALPDRHLTRPGCVCFPMLTARSAGGGGLGVDVRPNLSMLAQEYLGGIDVSSAEGSNLVWCHVLAVGYSPAYLTENEEGLRLDWPRIPLPNSKELLLASAELGRELADLLNPEAEVGGVAVGNVRAELRVLGVASRVDGLNLNPAAGDLAATAGWGYAGQGGVAMPGKGKTVTRPWTSEEHAAIEQGVQALGLSAEQAFAQLGDKVVDVYLNEVAYRRGVPLGVWNYTIGGYQVMKKWLSYRENALLGRHLRTEEVREVTRMVRRVAAILLLQAALDADYLAVEASLWE